MVGVRGSSEAVPPPPSEVTAPLSSLAAGSWNQ